MKINLIKICNWVGRSALTLPMYLIMWGLRPKLQLHWQQDCKYMGEQECKDYH